MYPVTGEETASEDLSVSRTSSTQMPVSAAIAAHHTINSNYIQVNIAVTGNVTQKQVTTLIFILCTAVNSVIVGNMSP